MKIYHFGHEVTFTRLGVWRYADDNTDVREGIPVDANMNNNAELMRKSLRGRVCPKCEKGPSDEGHDPCIVSLPGVKFACCGHGVADGYVMFEDGRILRGRFDHVG